MGGNCSTSHLSHDLSWACKSPEVLCNGLHKPFFPSSLFKLLLMAVGDSNPIWDCLLPSLSYRWAGSCYLQLSLQLVHWHLARLLCDVIWSKGAGGGIPQAPSHSMLHASALYVWKSSWLTTSKSQMQLLPVFLYFFGDLNFFSFSFCS